DDHASLSAQRTNHQGWRDWTDMLLRRALPPDEPRARIALTLWSPHFAALLRTESQAHPELSSAPPQFHHALYAVAAPAPGLARRITELSQSFIRNVAAFWQRIRADRDRLNVVFGIAVDDPLLAVDACGGDLHRDGQH